MVTTLSIGLCLFRLVLGLNGDQLKNVIKNFVNFRLWLNYLSYLKGVDKKALGSIFFGWGMKSSVKVIMSLCLLLCRL